jgi:hypothetical protein
MRLDRTAKLNNVKLGTNFSAFICGLLLLGTALTYLAENDGSVFDEFVLCGLAINALEAPLWYPSCSESERGISSRILYNFVFQYWL